MAHHRRKKSRINHKQIRDSGHYWHWPEYVDILWFRRPRRRIEKRLCKMVASGNADPDALNWPGKQVSLGFDPT